MAAAAVRGKRVGTRALATARCKIGLVVLLRDGSRRSWVVSNVPSPRQARDMDRLSDRDHLFTGESEGREEPFERDGTTRRSRGKKWHVVESGRVVAEKPGGFPMVLAGFGLGTGWTNEWEWARA
ncbi:hypothetical protein CRG98_011104 [Punica granatum]|uniref:Uncharacterized protein n=1 Tax=Punica granatum TaxID=22663 RepID=A0A2I0KJ28_PUNGR|nr:hypothetical protein CRG98_011104 [Punica granatum]